MNNLEDRIAVLEKQMKFVVDRVGCGTGMCDMCEVENANSSHPCSARSNGLGGDPDKLCNCCDSCANNCSMSV